MTNDGSLKVSRRVNMSLVALLGLGVAALPLTAPTAVAAPSASVCAPANAPDPSVSCIGGNTVDTCDRDPDGHRVYTRVRTTEITAPGFYSTGYDQNDSRSGCRQTGFYYRVTGISTCVQYEGCGPWRP